MYRYLSLLRLAELIARNSNRRALQELHNNRSVFYYHNEQPLRLVEFVDKLWQSKSARRWCNEKVDVLDGAYDLTISKFSNLPDVKKNDTQMKQEGPDCRYYFASFVKHVTKKKEAELYNSEAEKEIWMAGILQNFVIRHFHLSCLERSRTGLALIRRYRWKLDGNTLNLFLPVWIPGNQCNKWLTEHIGDVDPSRAGERDRVQEIVDRLVVRQKLLSLDSNDENEIFKGSHACRSVTEREIEIDGLAGAVADEKADNIEFQRPAIRQLGKVKLKSLIHQIFDSLACGAYETTRIADKAGISRSTFSRFAGNRWSKQAENDRNAPVPDLWLNTAEALACNSVFVNAAQTAGVWKRVEHIIETGNTTRNGA